MDGFAQRAGGVPGGDRPSDGDGQCPTRCGRRGGVRPAARLRLRRGPSPDGCGPRGRRPPGAVPHRLRGGAGRRGRSRSGCPGRRGVRSPDEAHGRPRLRSPSCCRLPPRARVKIMDSERLSATFVELADTLVADFDVLDFLHLLVTRCSELLDVSATGVLLADPAGDLRVMAASSEQVRLLELFQLQNDQGPCLDCYRSGDPISVPDVAAMEARWPRFTAEAQRRGFTTVVALPMRLRRDILGALNLFSTGRDFDPAQIQIAQALADVAPIGILQHRSQRQADTVVTQLQTALTSRVLVEQAKGILAQRLGIGMDEAFSTLRDHARANHRHLTELAEAIVAGTEDLTAMSLQP